MKVAFQFTADAAGLIGGVRVAREELDKLGTAAGTAGTSLRGATDGEATANLEAQRRAVKGTAEELDRLGAAANDTGAALRKATDGNTVTALSAHRQATKGLADDMGAVSARTTAFQQASAGATNAHTVGAEATRKHGGALQGYGREAGGANDNTLTLAGAVSTLKGAMGALSGALGLEALRRFGAEALETRKDLELLEIRLRSLTASGGEYTETQNFLAASANRLSVDQLTLTQTYAQLLELKRADLVTTGQARSILEGFVNVQKATGATTDALKQSLLGMAQGFSSGVLHAEELAQVTEPLPGLMQALDRASGNTAGGFRRMVNDGKVTSSMFRDVLIKAMQEYAGAAEKAANTIDAAETRRANAQRRLLNEVGRQGASAWGFANNTAADILNWSTSFLQGNARQIETNRLVALYTNRQRATYQLERATTGDDTQKWNARIEQLNALIADAEKSLSQLGTAAEDTRHGMAELWKETDTGTKITGDQIAAFTEAARSAGLSYDKGKLLTSGQAELGQSVSAVNALLSKSPDALKAVGLDAASLAMVLEHLREKLDPVTAAITQLKREAATVAVLPKFRDLYQLFEKAEQDKGQPLTTAESADLTAAWRTKRNADSAEQVRLTNEAAAAADKLAKAQASGNPVTIAAAQADKQVAEALRDGVIVQADAAAFRSGKLRENLAGLSGQAGEAATAASRQARQTLEMAAATEQGGAAVAALTLAHQIENETLKVGAGAHGELAKRLTEEDAARRKLAAAQWNRDLDLQIAATKALALAETGGAKAVADTTLRNQVAAQVEKEGVAVDGARAAAIGAKTAELAKWQQQQGYNQAVRQQDDDIQLLQLELSLQGEGETIRTRTLELARAELDIRRQFPNATEDEIAALLRKHATATKLRADIAEQGALWDELGRLGERAFDRVGSAITEAFAQGKASTISWGSVAKAVMSEVIQAALQLTVINPMKNWMTGGNAPSIFSLGSAANSQASGSGLTGSLTNTAMSKAGGWVMDKVFPGGISNAIDSFGINYLGLGSGVPAISASSLAAGYTPIGVGGLVPSAQVQAMQLANLQAVNAGTTGTAGVGMVPGMSLSGILGTAGIGAGIGGLLAPLLANGNKALGGLYGAGSGAAAGALAGTFLFPGVGTLLGALIGGGGGLLGGLLGTQKISVGPNAAGNLYLDNAGTKSGPSAGDNGMDGSSMTALTDALATSVNTIVAGIGATFRAGLSEMNFGHVSYMEKDKTWSYTPMAGGGAAGEKQTYSSQEEMVAGIIRDTLKRLDAGGYVTGVNADTRTALTNSKAKTAEDLANDLGYAAGFRQQLNAMTAALDPTNYQLGEFTKSAQEFGAKVKTNIVDWAAKAKELGLATDAELLPALQNGLTAMLGLGPVVQQLRGIDAVTKQAQINFETLKPSLEAAGFTAAQQADLQARYIAKARQDYLDGVNLIQAQGDTAIAALLDPAARLSAVTRMAANGFDMAIPGMKGLGQTIDAVELAARAGTLTTGDLTFALGQIDEQWRAGALTAEQYNASIQTITTAWQTSMGVINAMRQGDWAVTSAIDPTRKPDAGAILADAGIVSTAAGVAGFTTQLGAFLTTARAGQATAADLTYTHGQLKQLLTTGAITTQQYQTVLTSLTGAYTDATAAATTHADALATLAATIRTGSASVAALVDPTRKQSASDILADAGIDAASAGVAGFSTQLGAFLAVARAGTATTADLTYTYGVLERLLTSGVITGEQYQTVLGGITSAWTDGQDAATSVSDTARQRREQLDQDAGRTWTDAVTKAAQEVGDTWRTAANAARQAAADWTRVGDGMQQALDSLLVNNDLSNLGPTAMLDATEKQFTDAAQVLMDYQAKLQLGGRAPSEEERQAAVDAAGQMDALGQRYLEEARDYGLGAVEYQRRLEQVQGLWSSTRDMARSLATAETSRAQGLDRQIDWLSRLNDTMNGTGAASARLLEEIKGELIVGRVPASTPTTGAYTNFLTQLSSMQRGLSAADTAAGRPLGYTDYNSLRGQYLNAEQSSLSGATADELRKAYDAAKGVSAVVTQIVIDQMKAKGVSVSWADQFKTMFAAYAENDAAVRQRGGSDEQAAGNLQYWVGVRDRLAQDIPTSELLALLGQGSVIEPNSPDTWDLRVKYWLHQRGVPGFERGGQHVGGARVVGERGAELEVTGAARYWTHDQTRDILSPKSVSVTVDLAPVVTAIGGVTSAVMDIGRLIQDLSARVANVEEGIAELSRSHGQLAVQIRKLASR